MEAEAAATGVTAGSAIPTNERNSKCPPQVLEAIYGKAENKQATYDNSLKRWWNEYADRKKDEEDEHEHVANSLLYERNHLPRSAPAPDCVRKP